MKTREIADFLQAQLKGEEDVEIHGVADLSTATTGEIAFLEDASKFIVTKASCVIVPENFFDPEAETLAGGSVPVFPEAETRPVGLSLIHI